MVNVMVLPPLPVEGDTVIQPALVEAVHAHAAGAERAIVPEPPVAAKGLPASAMLN
jgi:hypothetical protein